MTEWWTYRLWDLLMFSARTYYRMFELYNAEVWPGHVVALAAGASIALLCGRRAAWSARAACTLLAGCWFWLAWAFHAQRYAQINWAAEWFAAAFAVEGGLLLLCAVPGARTCLNTTAGPARFVGLALMLFALVVQPWTGVLLGRPWQQAEVFGLAPDPTVVFTLGALLSLRPARDDGAAASTPAYAWVLWPIPLAWCAVGAATLWTMQSADAALMPCAAALALLAAKRATRYP